MHLWFLLFILGTLGSTCFEKLHMLCKMNRVWIVVSGDLIWAIISKGFKFLKNANNYFWICFSGSVIIIFFMLGGFKPFNFHPTTLRSWLRHTCGNAVLDKYTYNFSIFTSIYLVGMWRRWVANFWMVIGNYRTFNGKKL